MKTSNIKFVAEPQLTDDFDITRIKFGFRNRTELFTLFMCDFIENPQSYADKWRKAK